MLRPFQSNGFSEYGIAACRNKKWPKYTEISGASLSQAETVIPAFTALQQGRVRWFRFPVCGESNVFNQKAKHPQTTIFQLHYKQVHFYFRLTNMCHGLQPINIVRMQIPYCPAMDWPPLHIAHLPLSACWDMLQSPGTRPGVSGLDNGWILL